MKLVEQSCRSFDPTDFPRDNESSLSAGFLCSGPAILKVDVSFKCEGRVENRRVHRGTARKAGSVRSIPRELAFRIASGLVPDRSSMFESWYSCLLQPAQHSVHSRASGASGCTALKRFLPLTRAYLSTWREIDNRSDKSVPTAFLTDYPACVCSSIHRSIDPAIDRTIDASNEPRYRSPSLSLSSSVDLSLKLFATFSPEADTHFC